jgi:hypothetical protein
LHGLIESVQDAKRLSRVQGDLLALIEPANIRMQKCINLAHSELTKGHSTRAKVLLAPELSEEIPFGMGWKNSVVPPICTPLFLNISIFSFQGF